MLYRKAIATIDFKLLCLQLYKMQVCITIESYWVRGLAGPGEHWEAARCWVIRKKIVAESGGGGTDALVHSGRWQEGKESMTGMQCYLLVALQMQWILYEVSVASRQTPMMFLLLSQNHCRVLRSETMLFSSGIVIQLVRTDSIVLPWKWWGWERGGWISSIFAGSIGAAFL